MDLILLLKAFVLGVLIGKNSVTPSTNPKTKAFSNSIKSMQLSYQHIVKEKVQIKKGAHSPF